MKQIFTFNKHMLSNQLIPVDYCDELVEAPFQ